MAVMGDWWYDRRETETYKELKERFNKTLEWPVLSTHYHPAHLMSHYLNSDDVIKILKCNRRTALDYLQALRDIVSCYDPVWGGDDKK